MHQITCSRNSLSRAVAFHHLGRFRDRSHENQASRAAALNLVTAAIILFDCRYLGRAIDEMRRRGTDQGRDRGGKGKGERPGRQPLDMKQVEAAITLAEAKSSPAEAARQPGIGRSTIYREMCRLGISRPA